MSKDYYNILGVNKTATQDEIKKAFRKKAHEYHPDKATGDEAKFKEINEAYQVLGNENKRKQYDQFGTTFDQAGRGGAGFGGFDPREGFSSQGFNINFEDLGDIFGGFGDIFGGGARRSPKRQRGADLHMVLEIDFMEAVHGAEKEITLDKYVKCGHCQGNGAEPGSKIENCATCGGSGRVIGVQRTFLGNIQTQTVCPDCEGEGKTYAKKCSKCRGEGRVREKTKIKIKIPAGINEGETIRLASYGEVGPKGSQAGDLFVEMRIKEDKRFKRLGYDVKSKAEISFTQASLGDKIDIETVQGEVKLKIPEGTQPGTIFKLREKGIPRLRGRGKGDHLVEIRVKVPKGLSRKQKNLLQELDL